MLALRDVHAWYGKSHVLQGVTLDVAAGEVAGLLGRNGVGKTTTLKAVIGLVPPAEGRIEIDGRAIRGWPPYRIAAAGVGYVPEERRIFPALTVHENLLVGVRHLPPAVQQARLDTIFESFPRLKERLGQLGGALSGGEQQMLAIARVLVMQPRLVLIDEPTEGLMPAMTEEISHLIGEIRQAGVAVLVVDQNLDLLRAHCRVVHLMERGRIVQTLERDALQEGSPVLQQYLGSA